MPTGDGSMMRIPAICNFCAISSLIGANAVQRGCAYPPAALLAKSFGSCDPGRFGGSGWTLQSEVAEVAVGPAGRLLDWSVIGNHPGLRDCDGKLSYREHPRSVS